MIPCFAEFIVTFMFILLGCGSCVTGWEDSGTPTIVHLALVFGLSAAVAISIAGDVSGGHINPVVSVALCIVGRIKLKRCLFYIVAQCLGAIVGAYVLQLMTPKDLRNSIGPTTVVKHLTESQGFAFELIMTFILVLTVCAVTDPDEPETTSPGITIGLTICALHLVGIRFTGCSMNPARALGPSLVTSVWHHNHFMVYWLAPFIGSVCASVLYRFMTGRSFCKPRPKAEDHPNPDDVYRQLYV